MMLKDYVYLDDWNIPMFYSIGTEFNCIFLVTEASNIILFL